MSNTKYLSSFLKTLLVLTSPLLTFCSQTSNNSPTNPVEPNGVCTTEYKNEYLELLNLDYTNANLKNACDRFYQKYNDVKCMTEVEDVEVRVHTSDFDLKCSRGDFKDYTDPKKKKAQDNFENEDLSENQSDTNLPKCSNQVISYFQKTEASFAVNKNIITDTKSTDAAFNKALGNYRTCNQYFHVYKYSTCLGANESKFSFLNLKPYCQFFRNKLEALNKKYPTKYYPEELLPLIHLKLRLKLNDPFITFFSSLSTAKYIIAAGKSVPASTENKRENYCVFISKTLKTSAKIYTSEAKVTEIDKLNDNTWKIFASYGANSFEIQCRSARQIFLQDLKEILGNKTHIYND